MQIHPQRYVNLVRNIRNWPLHYTRKFAPDDAREYVFVTRRRGIEAHVPGAVYGIFKEMFMNATYPFDEICARLPQHPVVFDLGANIGLFTLALLDRIGDAVVHAFEPLPGNLPRLERNVESCRKRTRAKIHLHPFAVVATGSPSELPIYFDPARPAYASASLDDSRARGSNTRSTSVPTICIDSIVAEYGIDRIDLLKVDCEGAEFDIIPAIPAPLLRRIPNIVMEVHKSDRADVLAGAPLTPEWMATYLDSHGYTLEIVKGRRAWEIFAYRED